MHCRLVFVFNACIFSGTEHAAYKVVSIQFDSTLCASAGCLSAFFRTDGLVSACSIRYSELCSAVCWVGLTVMLVYRRVWVRFCRIAGLSLGMGYFYGLAALLHLVIPALLVLADVMWCLHVSWPNRAGCVATGAFYQNWGYC